MSKPCGFEMVFLSFDCTRHIFNLILANNYRIAIKDFVSLKIPAEIFVYQLKKNLFNSQASRFFEGRTEAYY